MAEGWSKISDNDEVPGRVGEILCEPCLNKDRQVVATKFCSSCNEFQCTDCSNVHDLLPILKGHKLVNAKEMKAKQVLFDMKGLDQCEQHKELLKFFCEDENKLCCGTCAIVDHRKCHSVLEVQKIAGKMTSQGSSLKNKLQEVKKNAELVVENIISSKQKVEKDAGEIPNTIRRKRDEVVQMFNDLEVSVVKKVETFKKDTLRELNEKQAQNASHIDEATQSLETINDVHKNGTSAQRFIMEQKMLSHINTLSNKVNEECQSVKSVVISFQFDETLKLPPLPVSRHVPGKLTLKSEIKSIVSPVISPMKLTPVISIDLKKGEDDESDPFLTGLDFLPDGRLVAVDIINKKCLVYNEKLEKVGSYQLSYYLRSVVVVSEDNVAITSWDQYKIDILKVSKINKITFVRSCKVKSKYFSICLKDDGHFVVGTVDDPVPVRIVSLSGEEKDFRVKFPNKKYSFDKSACTFIRNSNKIVIVDRDEDTVYIYDEKTDARVVVKDDQIRQPRGVAVGPSDTILVCSKDTHSIVQISETGQIISSYKTDMNYPYRICFSQRHSCLVVTDNEEGIKKLQKLKVHDT